MVSKLTTVPELMEDAKSRMGKSLEATRTEFVALRTGRANPTMLDRISVSYYGTPTPLKQIASIAAPEPRMLTVTPFDKSAIKDIERAIAESDLGLNPASDGNMIRLGIPEMTEERRRDVVKVAKNVAEEGRVAIRNIRRDVMHHLKDLKKNGDIGEDDERRAETELQKITDGFVSDVDAALKHKEAEIMEV